MYWNMNSIGKYLLIEFSLLLDNQIWIYQKSIKC